ncbi:MAG: zinc protease [Glaciecola sp.]|jgi:zinc protease
MNRLIETKPAPGTPAAWNFPSVTRTQGEGVTVVAAHLPGRPMVMLNVVVDAGGVCDAPGKEGTASLVAAALLKGARGLGEEDLAIAFETVGATPSGGAGFDSASFGLQAPAGLLGQASALLADVVRRPTLDTDEIEKLRQQRLDGFAASRSNPNYMAALAARQAYFAPDSRFAINGEGNPDSIEAITVDDVRGFHAERWAKAPLTVIVTGDLTGVDLDGIAAAFGADTVVPPMGAASYEIKGGGRRLVVTHLAGSVQSVLDFTAPGPKYDIPDAAELSVGQSVVLAAFSARVNQRLREDLGYTYGARGSFNRDRDGGTLSIGTQVRNEVTAETIKETFAVLDASLGAVPLTDDEVEQARDNLVAKFAVNYDGPGAVASAIGNRVVHGLADDDRDVMLAKLKMVTTAQANEAWRKYVNLDEVLVSVAGDIGAIRESLQTLSMPIIEASA